MIITRTLNFLSHFINSDLGLIRHTQLFIVFLNTVHAEDGRRKRPKHVDVINKQRVELISAFVGSSKNLFPVFML